MEFGPQWLRERLSSALSVPAGWCVAFSGGGDSMSLLHALIRSGPERPVRALHVNHGLVPEAADWEARCRRFCREHAVALKTVRVEVSLDEGEGPEDAARRARYGAFRDALGEGECLLLAHHRDDQAETLLLQLIRGAGPRGLAGMPVRRPLGRGTLARPLLELPRDALRSYARREGLRWAEDPGNRDPRFRRTAVRHELLPGMERRWPGVTGALARSARLCGDAAGLLRDQAEADLAAVGAAPAHVLNIGPLQGLSRPRQRNLLRHWFDLLELPPPHERHLDALVTDLLESRDDAMPCVRWPGAEVRRYRDQLHAMAPLPPAQSRWSDSWGLAGYLDLPPGCGRLVGTGPGRLQEPVTVGFRQGGERLRPVGAAHSRALKTLFQEAALPPWERKRLPVLSRGRELLAVADLWMTPGFAAELEARRAGFRWERPAA